MASFILDPFALATEGTLAPIASGRLCLQPFALASGGQFVIEAALEALADPYRGPNRWTEPFDRGFYLTKYGGPTAIGVTRVKTPVSTMEKLEPELAGTQADIAELQDYIREISAGLEGGLVELEAEQRDQVAIIARLEQNVADARDVLLLALETRRRQQNELAAIAAIQLLYY